MAKKATVVERVLSSNASEGRELRTCSGDCQARNDKRLPNCEPKDPKAKPKEYTEACTKFGDDFKTKHYLKAAREKGYSRSDPKHDTLVDGAASDYAPKTIAADKMSDVPAGSFLAFREKDRATALAFSATDATSAMTFSAHANWDTKGVTKKACREYVYKKYWDWSQFEGHIFACKHEPNCIYEVTMAELAPAAKNRGKNEFKLLRDHDGKKIDMPEDPFETTDAGKFRLLDGHFPKNLYFAINLPELVSGKDPLADVLPELATDLPELRKLLASGRNYYAIGPKAKAKAGEEGFVDEWTWQQTLHDQTALVPHEVTEDMRRRRTFLALNLAGTAVRATGDETAKEALESLGSDPYRIERALANESDFILTSSKMQALLNGDKAYTRPPITNERTSFTLSAGWQKDPKSLPDRPHLQCDLAHTKVRYTKKGGGSIETTAVGMCMAYNLLLDEWARLKENKTKGCTDEGNCGCLYIAPTVQTATAAGTTRPGHYTCDFSVKDFAKRWFGSAHYLRERTKDWNRCEHYEPFVSGWDDHPKWTASIKGFEDALKTGEATFRAWQRIPTVNKKNEPLAFGASYSGKSVFGDPDAFGASYEYDAGWRLDPFAMFDDGKKKPKVCQLSGQVWGSFRTDATVLGTDINIVDAGAWLVANKQVKDKPKGSGDVNYAAHFDLSFIKTLINGIELYETLGSDAWFPADADKKLEDLLKDKHNRVEVSVKEASSKKHIEVRQPSGSKRAYDGRKQKAKQAFFQATLSIGPVPITVQAGAGLSYGADFDPMMHAAPLECVGPIEEFEAGLSFKPHMSADAYISGGIGVKGFSVGARFDLTLVNVKLPVTAKVSLSTKHGIEFGVGADAIVSTLGGSVAFEFEVLFFHELITLFRWAGLGPSSIEVVPEVKEKKATPFKLDDLHDYVNQVGKDGAKPATVTKDADKKGDGK